ncbi:hypothetical protein PF007_g20180 [Phytophthora fragariae]|uniref:Uncharacterized protein n=1 Tax=Phytophthora fragariae TaxID=53985 RepID=A0A6A3R1J6_9STRA|nr:hypothetical protein PF003_g33407 [Phytophthora fragariae]KAE8944391.1 hypothetical protein PF009_g5914 [Phytophthora fragariae]KAE9087933.1 hypothetical protein PF007_g20180 [Phytophthora fragariae]KAE9112416.1 hypothetical protein PF006_g19985 [Phytophthora fragariae]KAE9279158.1 hypothetical protein PF001_g24841 [Phytophthora fragariae]
MARRRDVDADAIGLVEGELDTNDLEAAGCAVCALGARRPRLPTAPQVQLPASGAHVHSVTALVADAHALQRENQELRAQYEIVSAHNAGLAAHVSVLHDRNLAILHRAREGYRAGMTRLEQALLSRERVERDYADLEGRVADFRARVDRTEAAETLLRVERDSSAEQYRDLQPQLQAAQDQAADYAAQLARASAAPPPSSVPLARLFAAQGERDDARAERDDLRVALAAAQAALSPVQARVDAAEAERDRVRQLVATAEQQRDDALAERDRVTRVLVVAEQACDGALDMRDQACRISTALRRERDAAVTERDQARQAVAPFKQQRETAVAERDRVRQAVAALEQQRDAAVAERGQARQAVADLEQRRDAAVAERDHARLELTTQRQQRALVAEELRVTRTSLSQSRAESEAAQNLNVPLQDDLRRANALLVAHAEELRRGTTRIHELEESVATATTLRVAAESEMTRAKAGELGAASRAAQYRAGWMSVRRSSQRRREDDGTQVRRLNARVVELEGERDLVIRERDERAVAWHRMLRDARRGRELAQRVRDELADRLAGVVMGASGHTDTAGLIRQLKATFAAAIDAAVPLPPAVPTSAAVPAISAVSTPAVHVPAPAASGSGTRTGTSAATAAPRLALLRPVFRAPIQLRLRPLPRLRQVPSGLALARRVVRVLSLVHQGPQERRPLRRPAPLPSDVAGGPPRWPTLQLPPALLRRLLPLLRFLRLVPERTRRSSVPSLQTATIRRGEPHPSVPGCMVLGLVRRLRPVGRLVRRRVPTHLRTLDLVRARVRLPWRRRVRRGRRVPCTRRGQRARLGRQLCVARLPCSRRALHRGATRPREGGQVLARVVQATPVATTRLLLRRPAPRLRAPLPVAQRGVLPRCPSSTP